MKEFEVRTVNIFKTLSNPIRYRILVWLHKSGELTPTQMSRKLNRCISRISSHLKILRDAGLVRFRTRDKNVFYRLKNEEIISVIETVHEMVQRR